MTAGTQRLTVKRNQIVADLLAAYKLNDELCYKNLEIVYKTEGDESGDSIASSMGEMETSNQARAVFELFWTKVLDENFHGDNAKIPNDDAKSSEVLFWITLGRIFCHGLAIFGYIPVGLCRSALNYVINPESDIPQDVIINDFLLFVTEPERRLLQKALADIRNMTSEEKQSLTLLFDHYGFVEAPG